MSKYVILKHIMHGSNSEVYLIMGKKNKEKYILKKSNHKKELKIEKEALERIKSNIFPKYVDYWEEEESYLVMEYVEGRSLAEYRKSKEQLSSFQILTILLEVVKGIKDLHMMEDTFIYCDLKPENIIWNEKMGKLSIVDCGGIWNEKFQKRKIAGTIGYSAPEILRGGSISPNADIYSIGMLICFLLTGVHPYEILGDVVKYYLGHKEVKKQWKKIIKKCIAVNKELRYINGAELYENLNQIKLKKRKKIYEISFKWMKSKGNYEIYVCKSDFVERNF